ncbi:MAG: hypothetical protein ACRDBO_08895 [Lachnospiraceae bacterium]
MKNEKIYLIAEDTYHQHIDQEVHLYGLLHQLVFMTGKVKDAEDMEHFQETAIRYGEIADELFECLDIHGRYLVYGDKADLASLREKELEPVVIEGTEDTGGDDGECTCLRCVLEKCLAELMDEAEILAAAIGELDALGVE